MYPYYKPSGEKELSETLQTMEIKKSRLDRIIKETIKEFVDPIITKGPQKTIDATDKSVVDVKELGNGAEIITQW